MKLILLITAISVILLLAYILSSKNYEQAIYSDFPTFSIEYMARDSDIIILGVVESIDDPNYNIYIANIAIEEEFTNSYNEKYVKVKAYNTSKYRGEVSLEEGERVLLFLKDIYHEGYYEVPYGSQGKFIVKDGEAYNDLNILAEGEIINIIKESLNS